MDHADEIEQLEMEDSDGDISVAMNDIEEDIQLAVEILDELPRDDPGRPGWLSSLGNWLHERYLTTRAMDDLNEAIQATQEAIRESPSDILDWVMWQGNLCMMLHDKAARTGSMEDLNRSIQASLKCVEHIPEDEPHRAMALSLLSAGLSERYWRSGAMLDMEEALRVSREAVYLSPLERPVRHILLHNLGNSLHDRFIRIGDMSDLEEAIQVKRLSLELAPLDFLEKASLLSGLGSALREKYSKTKCLVDISDAIQASREAIEETQPEDSLGKAGRLMNLGVWLGDRYSATNAMIDLEEAIKVLKDALELTPKDDLGHVALLHNLGIEIANKFMRTRELADLEESVSFLEPVLNHTAAATAIRVEAGRRLFQVYSTVLDWHRAHAASHAAVQLMSKLSSRSLENTDKQYLLSQHSGLASASAAAALSSNKEPFIALDTLEQGRGISATSLVELRTDVLDLYQKCPQLADQFVQLRDELESPIPVYDSSMNLLRESFVQEQLNKRSRAGAELDKLILEIRQQPGFDRFLLSPTERELRAAASCGPIVVINVSEHRCDAIIMKEDMIEHLHLPNLDNSDVESMLQNVRSSQTLEWLWDAVASPILDALGCTQVPSGDEWPHVWWVPTGLLSRFPIHAAGRHDKSSTNSVLDRVVSSYSSSVNAIIDGRRREGSENVPAANRGALLVSMERTPGLGRLPFAPREIQVVKDAVNAMGFQPLEPKPDREAVISGLMQSRIFHFAGHGHADSKNPSASCLQLKDRLTVANLLEKNFRSYSPFLAYLSACSTGLAENALFADESVHLISAFQLAGFRHVIGTLWDVDDEICVDIARITYEGMRNGGMTDKAVCWGLHTANKQLRDRWLNMSSERRGNPQDLRDVVPCEQNDILNWAPYVHYGV